MTSRLEFPTRRAATRAALAICAWIAALCHPSPPVAHAQASGPQPVVVAGLRPTGGRNHRRTSIERLPEAQRLREIVEEVVRDIAQRPVVNHAGLRALLGPSYLVDFFDCKGTVKCVGRVFSPLRRRAGWLVYGDYAPAGVNYSFRLRLIDLASATLLADIEFSLRAREVEDHDSWNRQLALLLASVLEPPGQPGGTAPVDGRAGAEEKTDRAETREDDEDAKAGGAGGAGDAVETGRAGDREPVSDAAVTTTADDLTDADFGVVTDPGASGRHEETRDDGPWFDAATIVAMSSRWFDFQSAPDNEVLRPDGFTSRWTARLGGSVELYPLAALKRGGLLERIGLLAEYGRTDISSAGGRETELYVGASYRIPVGRNAIYPTFKVSAGFLRHDFVILDRSVDFPSVSYRGGVIGADVRVPIFTPRLSVSAGAHSMFLLPAGEIFTNESYGDSRVGGLDLSASLEIRPFSLIFVRIGARYVRFSLEFDGNGDLSSLGSTGAVDRSMAGTVATGIVL